MKKKARVFGIAGLCLSVIGILAMAFLYVFPYERIKTTRLNNVVKDVRLSDDRIEILSDYSNLLEFESSVGQKILDYDKSYFIDNILLVSIREGSYYSRSKVIKVGLEGETFTITYGLENDQFVVGNKNVEGVFYIDLIEYKKVEDKTYLVKYIDREI